MKQIAIVGLGLIGGSAGLDLVKQGTYHVIGVEENEVHSSRALTLGLVSEILPLSKAIHLANIIILAIPVSFIPEMLKSILDEIGPQTTVIDFGSTKQSICTEIDDHANRKQYVAAHPLAGTEHSGPDAALCDLFKGKKNIICDVERSGESHVKKAIVLFEMLGLESVYMTSEEHDLHLAYVSHLSHISSFMLGNTVLDMEKNDQNIFNLAGTGFASTVRLAKSNPSTWVPIFAQNQANVLEALSSYIHHLEHFKRLLETKETDQLTKLLENCADIRRILN